jgi:hypothetical protein
MKPLREREFRAIAATGLLPTILMATLLVSGCMSARVRTFGAVDSSDKTITVPRGNGLTGAIKETLAADGWKVTVYRGPEVTRGTMGEKTHLERGGTYTTRYTLFLRWDQFDTCVPRFDPAYNYDLSLVDNADGSEILTMGGRACEGGIVDKFRKALTGAKE